jgi:hypothetical protein
LLAEERAKIGVANKGRQPSASTIAGSIAAHSGKKHSPERVANMRAKLKGRKRLPETRARMRAAWALRRGKQAETAPE